MNTKLTEIHVICDRNTQEVVIQIPNFSIILCFKVLIQSY